MTNPSFSTNISVERAPQGVFSAINDVHAWWPEIDGDADTVGARFTHHFKDEHRCELEVKERIPGEKIVWHVLTNYFSFDEHNTEWNGTDIMFEIERRGDRTEVTFTHVGLVPDLECYEPSANAWRGLIHDDLQSLIEAGERNLNV